VVRIAGIARRGAEQAGALLEEAAPDSPVDPPAAERPPAGSGSAVAVSVAGSALEGEGGSGLQFSEPQEWALVRHLLGFDAVIAEVEEELLPNRLCTYLFELSQVFNRFYDQVPVLKAPPQARASRLALCRLTADTLKLGLGLLGIPTLERM